MRKGIIVLSLIGFVFGFSSCKRKNQCALPEAEKEVTTIRLNTEEFAKAIQDTVGVVLVDVRTPDEYKEGHIDRAIEIDFRSDAFLDECLKKLPRNKKIAFYCRNGFCSHSAAKMLKEKGYDVVDLIGGYNEWTKTNKQSNSQSNACKL